MTKESLHMDLKNVKNIEGRDDSILCYGVRMSSVNRGTCFLHNYAGQTKNTGLMR